MAEGISICNLDRDELFLEFDSKLLKYAPSGWVSYVSE